VGSESLQAQPMRATGASPDLLLRSAAKDDVTTARCVCAGRRERSRPRWRGAAASRHVSSLA
jgi:hypothetical protein